MPSSPLVDIQLIRGNPDGMALGVAIEPGAEDLESMRRAFFWAIRSLNEPSQKPLFDKRSSGTCTYI